MSSSGPGHWTVAFLLLIFVTMPLLADESPSAQDTDQKSTRDGGRSKLELRSGNAFPKESWRVAPTERVQLSLEEALQIALRNSFAVEFARLDRTIQERQEEIERSVYDPVFQLESDYSKNRQPTVSSLDIGAQALVGSVITNPFETNENAASITGRTGYGTQYLFEVRHRELDQPEATGSVFGFNPQDSVVLGIQLTQPLLRGAGKEYNSARIRIARNNIDLSQQELEFSAAEFLYDVEVAYWQLSFASKDHEARESAFRVALENLDEIQQGKEVGKRSQSDVLTARSQLLLRQVERNAAQELLYNTRDQLLTLLNQNGMKSLGRAGLSPPIAPFDHVWVEPTSVPTTEPFVPDRREALKVALRKRADYQRVLLDLDGREIQMSIARNERLPQLDVRARWEQLGLDRAFSSSFTDLGRGDYYNWSVGMEFSVPLGNRGAKNRHRQVRDQLRQVKIQRAQVEAQIYAQIDQAIRSLAALYQRSQSLEERVAVQKQLLDNEQAKLELGRTVYYNVSVIENDLIDSEAQALRSKVEYAAAKANYLRVTGMLLEERTGYGALREGRPVGPRVLERAAPFGRRENQR